MSVDLLQIIERIHAALPSLLMLVKAVGILIGVTLVIMSIRLAMKIKDMGRHAGEWNQPAVTFLIGITLRSMAMLIDALSRTVFGSAPPAAGDIMSYAPVTIGAFASNDATVTAMITGITAIIMSVGVVAVMRGLLMLNGAAKGAQGRSTFGSGLTHVIAGTVAINFPTFVGLAEKLIT